MTVKRQTPCSSIPIIFNIDNTVSANLLSAKIELFFSLLYIWHESFHSDSGKLDWEELI